MAARLQIEILAGPNVGESFEFGSETIGMGRSSQCQLQIPSPHVSRKQCELSWQGDQLVLENLGSVNHTYLNDRPIERAYVQDGDLVTFCDIALRVRIHGMSAQPGASASVAVPPSVQSNDGATHVAPVPLPGAPVGPQDTHPPGPARPQAPPMFAATGQPATVGTPAPPQPYQQPPQQAYQQPPQQPPQPPGTHPPQPPGHPPGAYPGVQQGYPGQTSGVQPGHPQAQPANSHYVARPAGMPGMPPGAASLQNPGAVPAGGGKRRARSKGGAGNSQLLRNIVIVGAVLCVLIGVLVAIIFGGVTGLRVLGNRGGESAEGLARKAGEEAQLEPEPTGPSIERGERSNEEILRQAQGDFQRGQVYFREAAIGDENLWESIRFYQRAQAELSLVAPELWPPFAREIEPQVQRAQGMLDKEYRRIKMSFVGRYQSNDWARANEDLELLMRIIPDSKDPRYMWAKKNKAKVKKRLRSMPKRKGPL